MEKSNTPLQLADGFEQEGLDGFLQEPLEDGEDGDDEKLIRSNAVLTDILDNSRNRVIAEDIWPIDGNYETLCLEDIVQTFKVIIQTPTPKLDKPSVL